MFSEIFGLLGSVDVVGNATNKKFRVNLNKNRIRSISAYSSNSIFYFPVGVSDQCTPEEVAMVSRLVEKTCASFVVACISLMPFHRVRADDKAAIEDYLSQFHQNINVNLGPGPIMNKAMSLVESSGNQLTTDDIKEAQDFLLEMWNASKQNCIEYVKLVANDVSLNEMFSADPVDPKTRVIQARFKEVNEEFNTWGFIGEATDDMFGDIDDTDDLTDDDIDDLYYDVDPNDYPEEAYDQILKDMDEAALKASARNKLSDDQFGLPSQRKFPLHDKKHVKLAIQMFGHCPEKDRPELARNIKAAAAKFNMSLNTSDDSAAHEYLSESAAVRTAINSIMFSLESVSENKIKSAKNLTKLRTLEAKLKKLKNKYVKYLNRYKRKYNENKRKGSKSKLSIRFNGANIDNPKAFMVQYGKYIKVINKRLKLIEKRREELNKRNNKSSNTTKSNVTGIEEYKIADESIGTELDESIELADHCLNMIDHDLNAPDSEIFEEIDEDDIDDIYLTEASGRNNRNRDPFYAAKQSSREREKAENERDAAQRQADRYKTLLDRERERNRSTETSKLTRAERATKNRDEGNKDFDMDYDTSRPKGGINPYRAVDARHTEFKTFDKEIFTNMDMNKANEAVPTFMKASIGFVIDETEEVVSRDVLIGVKAYVHRIPTAEIVSDAYNCVINKRKFLRFIKFITGEERSLSDLVFGIKELRNDALDTRNSVAGEWRSALKRRRRWSKISIPYLMKEYTPNGTIVMTMNEVEYIKSEYGIDIMTPEHVKMIMDTDFLLSFIIIDQTNEIVHVVYDGQGYEFSEYTYAMLERENNSRGQKELMQLYRAITR